MESILEAIGRTPLIPLTRVIPPAHARVFAKLERFNPGGSLKDRIVLKIVTELEKAGEIRPGETLVAGTTGNSGIALAYVANVKKYKVVLMMPEYFSLERRRMLEGYGAEVHLTPAGEGMRGAIERAREMARRQGAYFINQFERPETVAAHEESTAVEIETAVMGSIDAFVATVGTGGSLTGVGKRLKRKGAKVVAVEPAASPLLSAGKAGRHRIEGVSPGFVPPILDRGLIDEVLVVSDQQAFDGSRELARKEGMLVGLSSGAAMVAARKVARRIGPDKTVVTIFPDGGERYFSVGKYFSRGEGFKETL